MTLKKKLWLVLIVIMVVPVLGNVFIIDKVVNKDSRATSELIYNSGSLMSMMDVYKSLDSYVDENQPLTDGFVKEFALHQPIYDDRYAGAIILKEGREVYRSSYYGKSQYDDVINQLIQTKEKFMTIDGSLYYIKKPIVFSDDTTGKIIMGIDSEQVQKLSDRYWIVQMLWLSFFTVIVLFISAGYLLKSIGVSIRGLGDITKRLKNGELEEPLIYNKEDEFKELAIEIEQLRISLKQSLLKQEALKDEKRKMIGNLSHDIRTPLTAISGYAQALDDQVASSEAEKDEYLKIIQQKVGVIESLLTDLKALSDIDDKVTTYEFVEVSIEEFIRDCIEEVTYETSLRQSQISYNLDVGACKIGLDVVQMSRVFMNVIHNAVKYNDINYLQMAINGYIYKDKCMIQIEDNGIGVSVEELSKLFNRFYRVDKSRNSAIGGSGIGLSICRDIIEAHGGKIFAKASELGGLCIVIELPLRGLH